MVESSARPRGTGGHGLQAFQPAGTEPGNAQSSRARRDGNHGDGASDGNKAKEGNEVGTSGSVENDESGNESEEGDKEDVDSGLIGAASSSVEPEGPGNSTSTEPSLDELLALVGEDVRKDVQKWISTKIGNAARGSGGAATSRKPVAPSAPTMTQPAASAAAATTVAANTVPPVKAASTSTAAAVAPKITMSRVGEFFSNSVDTPEAIVTLLLSKHHLPLTMCTTAAMNDIATNPAVVKYTKIHDRWSVKRDLIDTSYWPSEATMSKEDWLDAYRNFDTILSEAAEQDVRDLFKDHFDFLCKRPEFRDSFAVILKFDIEVRKRFFVGTWKIFDVGSVSYCQRIYDVSLEILRSEMSKANAQSRGHQTFSAKRPFESSADSSGRSDSFRPFRSEQADAPEESFCLICGCRGHVAGSCTRQTTAVGRPIYAAWRDRRLVTIAGKKALCIYWNLRGRPCRPGATRCPGTTGHICSLCGASDHHAGAKRCRREG